MKIAVSNIAWNPEQTPELLTSLPKHGVDALVIAPTMVWPEAPAVDAAVAREFKDRVEEAGLVIAGMQSLVFGVKNVSLFGEPDTRNNLVEHLKRQTELAGQLGATSLIFGSPGLRHDVSRGMEERLEFAASAFQQVAAAAHNQNAKLTIEPLAGYGNAFITTTAEGINLVERVDHPGFGLHLDSAAVAGSGEDGAATIPEAMSRTGIVSFDASAPELGSVRADTTVPHGIYAQALRDSAYNGVVSLELRGPLPPAEVFAELQIVRELYGNKL